MVLNWIYHLLRGKNHGTKVETPADIDLIACSNLAEWSDVVISYDRPSKLAQNNTHSIEHATGHTQTTIPEYFVIELEQGRKKAPQKDEIKSQKDEIKSQKDEIKSKKDDTKSKKDEIKSKKKQCDQQNLLLYFKKGENSSLQSICDNSIQKSTTQPASKSSRRRERKKANKKKENDMWADIKKMTTLRLLEADFDYHPMEYIGMGFENRPRISMFKHFVSSN
ncbi:hypothetical protein MDAP_001829 [Mitosporidium daphniae]